MSALPALLCFGCSHMGSATLRRVKAAMPGVRLIVFDPDRSRASAFLADAAAIADVSPDLILLAVRPQTFGALPDSLRRILRRGPVVSIMAGVPLARIAQAAPGVPVIRGMPDLPATVGRGMGLGRTDVTLPPVLRSLVEQVFEAVGKFGWVRGEDLFERGNPVFGCGRGGATLAGLAVPGGPRRPAARDPGNLARRPCPRPGTCQT